MRMQMTNTKPHWRNKMTNKWNPEVGDKAAVCHYSDIEPCTVIRRTEKFVWVQMDSYKVDPEWKPDMRIGGFVAHTVNNHDQKHIITRNEKGYVRRFGIRKDGYWYASGQRYGANYLTKGWRRFYDYNF